MKTIGMAWMVVGALLLCGQAAWAGDPVIEVPAGGVILKPAETPGPEYLRRALSENGLQVEVGHTVEGGGFFAILRTRRTVAGHVYTLSGKGRHETTGTPIGHGRTPTAAVERMWTKVVGRKVVDGLSSEPLLRAHVVTMPQRRARASRR